MDKKQLNILFGEKVVELRKKRNKTQEEMAFDLKTSLRQYGRIERGESSVRMDTICKLANYFGIHPKEFFDFDL